ncbi:hypothetical protein B0H11DRAFT_1931237 [Mycena galericulata]|nr:hypothetical protein B0H11DRAFT_1931237 [Mycena galericulata]
MLLHPNNHPGLFPNLFTVSKGIYSNVFGAALVLIIVTQFNAQPLDTSTVSDVHISYRSACFIVSARRSEVRSSQNEYQLLLVRKEFVLILCGAQIIKLVAWGDRTDGNKGEKRGEQMQDDAGVVNEPEAHECMVSSSPWIANAERGRAKCKCLLLVRLYTSHGTPILHSIAAYVRRIPRRIIPAARISYGGAKMRPLDTSFARARRRVNAAGPGPAHAPPRRNPARAWRVRPADPTSCQRCSHVREWGARARTGIGEDFCSEHLMLSSTFMRPEASEASAALDVAMIVFALGLPEYQVKRRAILKVRQDVLYAKAT